MKQSKLNERYSLNADGTAATTTTTTTTATSAQASTSTPWYGYIGDWLNGVGSVIGSTKEPADVNYYNYSNNGQSNSMLWILAAIAAVVLLVLFTKK